MERLRETEKYTPKERAWRNPDTDPSDKKWLTKGEVELEGMSMKYAEDMDPVLKVRYIFLMTYCNCRANNVLFMKVLINCNISELNSYIAVTMICKNRNVIIDCLRLLWCRVTDSQIKFSNVFKKQYFFTSIRPNPTNTRGHSDQLP